MALDLLSTQKATISVALDDGNGNVTELGDNFHFTFSDPTVAELVHVATGLAVSAKAAGTTGLHITTMDGSVQADLEVTVTQEGSVGVPTLIITVGTPVAK